jgi:hypothetical protein
MRVLRVDVPKNRPIRRDAGHVRRPDGDPAQIQDFASKCAEPLARVLG